MSTESIAEILILSARAADDLKIKYGSPAVQAGRALAALPSVDAAIAHVAQTLKHLQVLQASEAGELPTLTGAAAE